MLSSTAEDGEIEERSVSGGVDEIHHQTISRGRSPETTINIHVNTLIVVPVSFTFSATSLVSETLRSNVRAKRVKLDSSTVIVLRKKVNITTGLPSFTSTRPPKLGLFSAKSY
uniref:Uncharacterized protein n=1 Tax=Timema genevievae TaxID=629358 RepID=A0A7R9JNS3_TIMGE|nr:unnamed protein product [Timema genevievae]